VEQPPRFESFTFPDDVYKLSKALYRLRQSMVWTSEHFSSREWF